MKKLIFKKTSLLIASAIVLGLVLSSCSSKKVTNISEQEEELVTFYCDGPEYRTDKEHFRANAVGESFDQMVSKKKSSMDAKALLAGKVETVVKNTTDNYVNSREFNNVEEVEERFESLNREVIKQQLNNLKVICQKTTRTNKGKYKTYIAIEMAVDDIEEAVKERVSKDERLRIDYDYENYKETFEKEMEKLNR